MAGVTSLSINESIILPPPLHPLFNVHHNSSEHFINLLTSLNATIDPRVYSQFSRNRKVDDPFAFFALIAAYSLLIIVGATGNSLVVCAVVRKPAMRTARNMFIVNLAVSDLLLCLITMPLTLMEILTKYWPLGRQAFICKMLGTLQATSIFVSTISITAIALDRYQVIVYPTRKSLQKVGAVAILTCIWVTSFILASPMFIWKTLKHIDIKLPNLEYISYCLEDWPVEHGRAYYSIFSLVFQYLLPIITVTTAYSRICHKLQYRYVNTSVNKGKPQGSMIRKSKDDRRAKRTNSLLYSIALIFCISWLPLNIINLVMDLWYPFVGHEQTMIICYAICHMIGMSSACSNPLLYGWLNENFRKEFHEIAATMCVCMKLNTVRESVGSMRSSLNRRRRRQENKGCETGEDDDESGRESMIKKETKKLASSKGQGDVGDSEQTALTWRRGTETENDLKQNAEKTLITQT